MRDERRMGEKMKILITNDDGIEASGIVRLAEAARKFGEVYVVAPDGQRSAASHSITLHKPIDVYETTFPVEGVKAYKITGTPADCVRVGVLNIVPDTELVMSGINFGYNAGTDVQYSATVGAAMEAAFQKRRAIAFSEGTGESYLVTDAYLERAMELALQVKTGPMEIVNVNFPTVKLSDCKGFLMERKPSRDSIFHDRYSEEAIPGGKRYMVDGIFNSDVEEGSDLKALFDGYISIGVVQNIGCNQ